MIILSVCNSSPNQPQYLYDVFTMPTNNPVSFQVYLSKEEKHAFKSLCHQLDTDMSREARRLIRAFIANPPEEHYQPLKPLKSDYRGYRKWTQHSTNLAEFDD